MSNALRHVLGLLIGLLLAPVLAFGLAWAPRWPAEAGLDPGLLRVPGAPEWAVPVGVLLFLALLLGLLMGSRISPLAALVAGLALAALGALRTAAPPEALPRSGDLLTPDSPDTWFAWGPVLLLAGAALVFSALWPSRWRGRRRRDDRAGDTGYDSDYGSGYDTGYSGRADDDTRFAEGTGPGHGRHHRRDDRPGGPGPSGTPPQGTPTTVWDADGMPPRYHTSGQAGSEAGWTDPPRSAPPGGGPTDTAPSRPPRWEDSGPGVSR
ncbi:hypothetical protein LG943_16750 [Streptomonospora sp. S1-112]|uniref:Tryptophan-associated transmembrane protein n=1 Tax=Streptomonospora mangrovi TaxID=2883123 RepID=A0A9X3SGG3_9ACTN|nr:hypothetical protein [Streptomonospora mangrovi]MDA0565950.1 hypothetical protein [Streptomonospora mangrovi]